MATPDSDDDAGAKAGAAKAKKKKMMIIGGAAGALLLVGGGGGYFALAGGGEEHGEEVAAADAGGGHGAKAEAGGHGEGAAVAGAAFVDLPEMTVNLATVDQERQQYVRLSIALEVEKSELAEALKPMMPRVIDSFQTHLREVRSSDLRGSAGMYRLKEELLRRVNVAAAPVKVDAVLFKDIVVQ